LICFQHQKVLLLANTAQKVA